MHSNVPFKTAYLGDPCGTSSLPYWKTVSAAVPEAVRVVREDAYTGLPEDRIDTPYFKLLHDLSEIPDPSVPEGFELIRPDERQLAAHIAHCYAKERVTAEELETYRTRRTYREELWIALRDKQNGEIAASGVAELDDEIGEGVLEWVQVSPQFRRMGLGTCIVAMLLSWLAGRASFVTVSGRVDNPTDPYALYVRCGFSHPVIWHVLQKKRDTIDKESETHMREKSCGAVVFTREGAEIRYVIVRSKKGIHGFPKGHVEPGENERETALREIREEVGLEVALLDGFRTEVERPLLHKPGVIKTIVYFAAEYGGQAIVPQQSELSGAALMTYDEAMQAFEFETAKRVLQEANAFLTAIQV